MLLNRKRDGQREAVYLTLNLLIWSFIPQSPGQTTPAAPPPNSLTALPQTLLLSAKWTISPHWGQIKSSPFTEHLILSNNSDISALREDENYYY